jgi:hypothetical protein
MMIEEIFEDRYLSINVNLGLLMLTAFLALGNTTFTMLFIPGLIILAIVLGLLIIKFLYKLSKFVNTKTNQHRYEYNCARVSIDSSMPKSKIIVGEIQISFLFLLLTVAIISITHEFIPVYISVSTIGLITYVLLREKAKRSIIKSPPSNPLLDSLAKDMEDDDFWKKR